MLAAALRAITLGILQGITEFIPISSSAHLIIIPWLLHWNDPALTSLPFDVALHLGTLVAVLWFFAAEWKQLARAWLSSLRAPLREIGADPERRLAWLLIVGCIPGAFVGALAESKIEMLFHRPNQPIQSSAMITMAIVIALMGALLFLADHLVQHQRGLDGLRLKDSLMIGLAQAAAVFPGVSRSGSTITAGLAVGLKREAAARFSFMLSAPIIAGAGVKSLLDVFSGWTAGEIAWADLILFPIGFFSAAISGYLCIKFLLRFLQQHSTDIFVYYRWALALLITIIALIQA